MLIWKEFNGAAKGTAPLVVLMFIGYALGLALIGFATLVSQESVTLDAYSYSIRHVSRLAVRSP